MKTFLLFIILTFASITSYSQCSITITNLSNSCQASCQGFISLAFQGGAMPYTFTFGDGTNNFGPFTVTTAFSWGNLCPANYTGWAIDSNGDTCSIIQFEILAFSGAIISVTTTNASCPTCTDGSAAAFITGGNPPYSYLWSNGATTQSINNLSTGIYTIYVTEASGCTTQHTFCIGVGSSGCESVSGIVYMDLNLNGIKDVGESGIGNRQISINPPGAIAFTNNLGEYQFYTGPGNYDVTLIPFASWILTSAPPSYNVNVTSGAITGLDFGLYPDSSAGAATISLYSGFPRCFWDVQYYISINNVGYTILDGTISFTHDTQLTFVSSSETPTSHTGNQIEYAFTGLWPGQSHTITVIFTEPAGGTNISSSVQLNANDTLGNLISESKNLEQTVSCAYDPNDKQVNPPGIGTLNYVAMDEWLTYQVRFQNTGNDTAFRVVILDTLDTFLDMSTFTFLSASHNVDISILPGREVNFIFDNIFLPDSIVNEPASHGYVLYRIKGLSSNPDPTSVTNSAYIYFDLNSPIQTNTTLTTFSDNYLSIPESGNQNIFELYPNPMSESAILRLKENTQNNYTIIIYDVTGRIVRNAERMTNGSLVIEKHTLNSGLYFIEALSSDGNRFQMKMMIN